MADSTSNLNAPLAGDGNFATTHWSLVIAAGNADSERSRQALETLCRTYWYPLYAFVRRQGHSPHDAQDLTQEFFARFLASNPFGSVQRERGKFRSFLLASLKHFLANEWDRARALKRGGGQALIAWDATDAEARYALEPQNQPSADRLFDRRWAMTVLDRVLQRLRAEHDTPDKRAQFDALKGALTGERGPGYAELSATLGLSEGAIKVAVHRLRQRYRDLLRAEIAETVATPAEVDEELQNLQAALRG